MNIINQLLTDAKEFISRQIRKDELKNYYNSFLEKLGMGCHFCKIHESNKIKMIWNYWICIENQFPYYNAKEHYVVVLKRHLANHQVSKLTDGENRELVIMREYFKECTLLHNPKKIQSVDHLHFQLVKF